MSDVAVTSASRLVPVAGGQFSVVKGTRGEPVWVAVHTNKYIDDDIPPDILSEASHKAFIDRVYNGEVPMPELWLWHIPVKIGDTKWIGWHSAGFVVSAGTFVDPVWAAALSKSKIPLGMSHGMMVLARDKKEPHVITDYVTHEISVLPVAAAANKLTGFSVGNGGSEKMIDKTQRDAMVMMVGEDQVAAIESALEEVGEKAVSDGRLFKESSPWTEDEEDSNMENEKSDAEVVEETIVPEAVADVAVEQAAEEPAEDEPEEDAVAGGDGNENGEPVMEDPAADDGSPDSPDDLGAQLEAFRMELSAVSDAVITLTEMVGAAISGLSADQKRVEAQVSEIAEKMAKSATAEPPRPTMADALARFAKETGHATKSAIGDPGAKVEESFVVGGPVLAEKEEDSKTGLFIENWLGR